MDALERVTLLRRAYRLFNERRIDDLLALMTENVAWPDVANRAVLHGKVAIRSYWEAQFAVASPQVSPTDFLEVGDDLVAVVEQCILALDGQPLAPPTVVFHRYTFTGDRVCRMVVFADRAAALVSS